MGLNPKLSATVAAEKTADKADRQAIKAAIVDIQAVIDGITAATTLADLRGYVKDLAKVTKRLAQISK